MNKFITYRREFHHYAELGWRELRTSARVAELLEEMGYRCLMGTEVVYEPSISFEMLSDEEKAAAKQKAEDLLAQLRARLRTKEQFPHEIGLFLGYPLRDVIGFIENRGQNFTCCGFWKSYSDPAQARECFACYQKCISDYTRMFGQGVPIEELALLA